MAKLCVSCEKNPATLRVRGTSDVYCEQCAIEHFGDVGFLDKIEDQAKMLKEFVDDFHESNPLPEEHKDSEIDTKDIDIHVSINDDDKEDKSKDD